MSDTLINALKVAVEHIEASAHGNDCFLDDGEYNRCFCMKDSVAAHLTEVLNAAVALAVPPEGWKLVPITPTVEMSQAADESDRRYSQRVFGDGTFLCQSGEDHWAAMLAAAPEAKPGYVLVPADATDDMEVAAENDYEQTGATFPDWKSVYRAMISAAGKAGS